MDFYAGSPEVKHWMESALSREWKRPVEIGGLHYTPWGGLRAADVTAAFSGAGATGVTSFSVPSVSAKVAFGPLFSGRVVLKKLVFHEPSLVWMEGSPGMPPQLPEAPNLPKAPEQKAEKPRAPAPVPAGKPEKRFRLELKIQAVQIQNATCRFLDRKGREIGALEGVEGRGFLEAPRKIRGTLSFAKASLDGRLTVEAFSSPFVFEGDKLVLNPMDARLAGGSVRGEGTLIAQPGLPPFTLDLLFDNIGMEELLTQIGEGQPKEAMAGALFGNLDLYGRIGDPKSLGGAGQLRLRGGGMEQFTLLQFIGKFLPVEELNHLDLQQAQLDLRLGDGQAYVDSLVLESLNLSFAASGTSQFDGRLNLAARLAINPKVSRQLPGWVAANFQPVPGTDRRDIAFTVRGTLLAPETDLMQVILGQHYGNQILNLWQSLTGKPKKKVGDQKKTGVAAPPVEEGEDAAVEPSKPQPADTP